VAARAPACDCEAESGARASSSSPVPFYQVVVLAVVQGVTEFLPISSTAHLALVPWVFGWRDPGLAFDIALHLGTLVAVALYFARTWIRVLFLALGRRVLPPPDGDPDRDLYDNPRLFWFLVAATVPAGLAGLAFEDQVETTLRSPLVIAAMMIAVGILLWWAERGGPFHKNLGRLSLADALAIGLAQALAIVPGTSRSGITMAAALLRGVDRPPAARFSFLLSTPIIAGATLKTAFDLARAGIPPDMVVPFVAGIVISGLTGYLVIAWLIRYLQTSTFRFFVWYRMICGIIILALAFFFRAP
jgi:undecaprenyl-diphosphatase